MEKIGLRVVSEMNVFDINVVRYALAREDYRSDESTFIVRSAG